MIHIYQYVCACAQLAVCDHLGRLEVYILASLVCYTTGLLLLAVPSMPNALLVRLANVFASLGRACGHLNKILIGG